MATTSPNMGLKTWDLITDNYSHADLRADFVAIDSHDHSPTKGVPISAAGLSNLSVSTSKLQDQSVTTGKLALNAVTTAQVTDGSITYPKLAAGVELAFGNGLQAGMMGNVNPGTITATLTASTGAVTLSPSIAGEAIWTTASNGLMRSIAPAFPASFSITALAIGAYAYVSVDYVPPATYGGTGTFILTQSAAQSSVALAAAAITSVASGNIRVWDGIVVNVDVPHGYSVATTNASATWPLAGQQQQRDRRLWAQGAHGRAFGTAGTLDPGGSVSTIYPGYSPPDLSLRLECSGAPVRIEWHAKVIQGNSSGSFTVWVAPTVDGSLPTGLAEQNVRDEAVLAYTAQATLINTATFVPPAGSHLFQLTTYAGGNHPQLANNERWLVVREVLSSGANGTA